MESIEEIIKKLERANDLLCRGKHEEAAAAVYDAQCMAIFVRDNDKITR